MRTILENGMFAFSWFQPPTAKRVFKLGFFCLSALNLGYNLPSFHSYMANVSVFLLILAKEYTRWVHAQVRIIFSGQNLAKPGRC